MTFKTRFWGSALIALACQSPAYAQANSNEAACDSAPEGECPSILVTASRKGSVPIDSFTGSVTVISAEQIENRQVREIGDVLRDIPGVAVANIAGQTQIRLRGTEANHVLVLVDGIEVSDPFVGEFDIGTLQAEIGSRIEIVRGPQSALFGNDAIGGIVGYESASGRDLAGFQARAEGGSDATFNAAARYGFANADFDAALSASYVSTDGQPNALPLNPQTGRRDIGRESLNLSAKGGAQLSDALSVRIVGRYANTEGDFNNQDFSPGSDTFGFVIDSPETRFENEAFYGLAGLRLRLLGGDWTHDLSAQFADITRDTRNQFGPSNSSEGDRFKASYITAYDFGGSDHTLSFAADFEEEGFRNTTPGGFSFDGRRSLENIGLVGEYRYAGERLDIAAALRHDLNDRFADVTTFKIGAGYAITDTTRIRASAGSGIKNPGFFELFGFVDGQFNGNEALRPEKLTGFEVGIDQRFADDKVTVSLTYFDSELEDEIITTFPAPDFVSTPDNAETLSTQRGLELSLAARLFSGFSLNAAYTYLDAEEDGFREVRRPNHTASAALTWNAPGDKASATLVARYNGEAEDVAFLDPSFVSTRVDLADYLLINANAQVALSEAVELFARIDNLLDEEFQPVFSFVNPGRSAVAGVTVRF